MKKGYLLITALLVAGMVNAADKNSPAPATGKSTKKTARRTMTITPAMLKKLQMAHNKPIDWSFLPAEVAEIGGKAITKQDFIKFFNDQMKMMPYVHPTTAQVKHFAPKLVEQLVTQKLLLEMATKAGFKPSAKLVTDTINKNLKKMPPEKLAMIRKQFQSRHTTLEQYIQKQAANPMIQLQYAIGAWAKSQIKSTTPSDAELKAFYDKNKDNMQLGRALGLNSGDPKGSMRASHILIKVDGKGPDADAKAKAKAEEILKKLKAGGDFAKLAQEYSACPSKQRGGSLGAFQKGSMVKPFEDAVAKLQPGQLSGVVKTQFGYHIIRRDKSKPFVYTPFDKVKQKIIDFLKSKQERKEFGALIKRKVKEAKKANKVKIFVKAPAKKAAPKNK